MWPVETINPKRPLKNDHGEGPLQKELSLNVAQQATSFDWKKEFVDKGIIFYLHLLYIKERKDLLVYQLYKVKVCISAVK